MTTGYMNANALHAAVAARTLANLGARAVVISPGSRSTPLTHAFVNTPELDCTPVLDERTAGFFALGRAKASGLPAVLRSARAARGPTGLRRAGRFRFGKILRAQKTAAGRARRQHHRRYRLLDEVQRAEGNAPPGDHRRGLRPRRRTPRRGVRQGRV